MFALGQKRTSANKLEAVLLVFRGRAASPRTCRRCQDHLHYRTTWQACLGNAGGRQSPLPQHQPWVGATDNPHDWEDAIGAPSPRASEGGRSRQSPLECCHHWALSSAYFVAFTGRFIHGNEVSPGNLCREPAAVA